MSHKKFGPDRFSRFDVHWIQTDKQTDKPNLHIDIDTNIKMNKELYYTVQKDKLVLFSYGLVTRSNALWETVKPINVAVRMKTEMFSSNLHIPIRTEFRNKILFSFFSSSFFKLKLWRVKSWIEFYHSINEVHLKITHILQLGLLIVFKNDRNSKCFWKRTTRFKLSKNE